MRDPVNVVEFQVLSREGPPQNWLLSPEQIIALQSDVKTVEAGRERPQ